MLVLSHPISHFFVNSALGKSLTFLHPLSGPSRNQAESRRGRDANEGETSRGRDAKDELNSLGLSILSKLLHASPFLMALVQSGSEFSLLVPERNPPQ